MTIVNYKMKVFNAVLFGLVFGIGLFLTCNIDTSRECTIERYKVNSTEKVHGLYMYITTSDNTLCYSGWIEIAIAPTYREVSHLFDRLIETRPLGSKIKCHKKDDIIPTFGVSLLGLIMIIGSIFILRS